MAWGGHLQADMQLCPVPSQDLPFSNRPRTLSRRGRENEICGRMIKAADEVVNLFGATPGRTGNLVDEVYPSYPGLVVTGGELYSMVWGFPRSQAEALAIARVARKH